MRDNEIARINLRLVINRIRSCCDAIVSSQSAVFVYNKYTVYIILLPTILFDEYSREHPALCENAHTGKQSAFH